MRPGASHPHKPGTCFLQKYASEALALLGLRDLRVEAKSAGHSLVVSSYLRALLLVAGSVEE